MCAYEDDTTTNNNNKNRCEMKNEYFQNEENSFGDLMNLLAMRMNQVQAESTPKVHESRIVVIMVDCCGASKTKDAMECAAAVCSHLDDDI